MNINHLRYFVQIVESGSLSKAAEHLRIAQPALSLALRNMERELGVQLVTRHARGVVPNEVGNLLLTHARSILRDLSHMQQAIQHRSRYPRGEVLLGLPTSAARGLIPVLMKAAKTHYPEISLQIIESMSGYLGEWLLQEQLDLALLYNPKLLHMADSVRLQKLLVEDLDLICPGIKQYRNMKAVRFADLKSLPLVQMTRPHVIRSVLEAAAQKSGSPLNFVLNVNSMSGIIELVLQGYLTIFPKFAVQKELQKRELCAVPIIDPGLAWDVFIATARRGLRSRAVELVNALILKEVKALVEAGAWPSRLVSSVPGVD